MGVDGDDLPQTLFALGVVSGDRTQPQPGVFVVRLGDEDEVEEFAGFIRQIALRGENALG